MSQQASGIHLNQVNVTDGESTGTCADIIAIHGLDTQSPNTWTWKSRNNKPAVNWLADPTMLPGEVGQARIFVCDWPARIFQRSLSLPLAVKDCARLLLAGIQDMRQRPAANGQVKTRPDRPILFIASCFGGIILMEALVVASQDRSQYASIRRATRGIVFLATPFRGTAFQDIAGWAVPMLKTWAWLQDRQVTVLLDSVKGPAEVEELVSAFTRVCQDRLYALEVFSFYETERTVLQRKALPAWAWPELFFQAKLVSNATTPVLIAPTSGQPS